ncbi:MAG TPA: hypothetical protein VE988_30735 [Gemmataceae bacterium]|nr:hypothetical protein [Gemmataceae bacterium]
MTQAIVQSPWIGMGSRQNPYRPQLHDDFPGLKWSDATGLPVAQIAQGGAVGNIQVTCTDAVLNAIKAHPRYSGHVVVMV